jgi:hypothetical protein
MKCTMPRADLLRSYWPNALGVRLDFFICPALVGRPFLIGAERRPDICWIACQTLLFLQRPNLIRGITDLRNFHSRKVRLKQQVSSPGSDLSTACLQPPAKSAGRLPFEINIVTLCSLSPNAITATLSCLNFVHRPPAFHFSNCLIAMRSA